MVGRNAGGSSRGPQLHSGRWPPQCRERLTAERPFAMPIHAMPPQRLARPELPLRETSLYAPVKLFLEALGFDVKGEICGCDLVALRGGEPPLVVVGELKLGFNLELILQAVNRTAACDQILACRPHVGARRTRARSARAQTLPSARVRASRRVVHGPRRGHRRAGTLAAAPRRPAAIAPRRRTSAARG